MPRKKRTKKVSTPKVEKVLSTGNALHRMRADCAQLVDRVLTALMEFEGTRLFTSTVPSVVLPGSLVEELGLEGKTRMRGGLEVLFLHSLDPADFLTLAKAIVPKVEIDVAAWARIYPDLEV